MNYNLPDRSEIKFESPTCCESRARLLCGVDLPDLLHYATDVKKLSITNTPRWGRLEWQAMTLNGVPHMFCYFARFADGTYPDAGLLWTMTDLREELVAQSTTGLSRWARIVSRLGDAAAYALENGLPPQTMPTRKTRKKPCPAS